MSTLEFAPRLPFNFDPETAEYIAVRPFETSGIEYKPGDKFVDHSGNQWSIAICHAFWKSFNLGEKTDPWTDEAIERSKNEEDLLAVAVKPETVEESHKVRGWGEPVTETEPESVDLNDLTRKELEAIADAKGISYTKNDNKSKLVELIEAKMEEEEPYEQSDT